VLFVNKYLDKKYKSIILDISYLLHPKFPSSVKGSCDLPLAKLCLNLIECFFSLTLLITEIFKMNINRFSRSWYVVYTYPKAEQKANKKLKEMGITSFLPLHKVVRQWSDRKKKLEVPLFPSYIFIYILPHEGSNVLKIKGIIKFVTFEGKRAVISDVIIDSLKNILKGDVEVTNENFCNDGAKVKISQGHFAGAEGVLIRKNGKTRLLVQIEVLHISVFVDVPAGCVKPVSKKAPKRVSRKWSSLML
jgi:transcription antitermination factor NusG